MARAAVVIAVLVGVLGGCSLLTNTQAIEDAGYSVNSVSVNSTTAGTDLEIAVTAPPGRSGRAAIAEVQRIVWRTHPGRIDRLTVYVDGQGLVATAPQLEAAYGPRDPRLEQSSTGTGEALGVAGMWVSGITLAVLVVATAVMLARGRRADPAPAVPPPGSTPPGAPPFGPPPFESPVDAPASAPPPPGPSPYGAPAGLPPGPPPPGSAAPPAVDPTHAVGARIGGGVIDYLIWVVPSAALWVGAILAAVGFGAGAAVFGSAVIVIVIALAWGWFSYAWWASRRGRTIGMRVVGLRIVAADGRPVTLRAHTLRWLLFILDGAVWGLVGLLTIAVGQRHQRVGDMVAGTLVVRDR